MKIVFASNNSHKLSEVRLFLEPKFKVISLSELRELKGEEIPEMPETGTSYAENAQIKAEIIFNWAGLPVFADDSGLEVAALGGAPGIYSARYAGQNCSSKDNINKLLANLAGVQNRSAALVCFLHFISNKQQFQANAEIAGQILETYQDVKGGFGYDPIFFIPDQKLTLAEIKNQAIDFKTHRERALINLREQLIAIID